MADTTDIEFSLNYKGPPGPLIEILRGADIKQELIDMAKNINDISASVAELRTAIAAEHQEVADLLAQQQLSIDELKALVAAAGTQEEIEAALADIQSAKDEVSAIVTVTPPEVPNP